MGRLAGTDLILSYENLNERASRLAALFIWAKSVARLAPWHLYTDNFCTITEQLNALVHLDTARQNSPSEYPAE